MEPSPVSCLKNPRGQRTLAGYSSWGHKESDMTEQLSVHTKPSRKKKLVFQNSFAGRCGQLIESCPMKCEQKR